MLLCNTRVNSKRATFVSSLVTLLMFAGMLEAFPLAANEELDYPVQAYSFGYDVVDEHYGTQLHRAETRDDLGIVRGTYGYMDPSTGLSRQVVYVADQFGYRASVLTNEPNMQSHEPASAVISTGNDHGVVGPGQAQFVPPVHLYK